jgi:predicted transcriptional regulator
MTLVNIQLPVPLVGRLDQLAEQATARRPGIIREALTAYVNAPASSPTQARRRDMTERYQARSD